MSRAGPDDLLSEAEVAELFGCSVHEVGLLMRAGGVVFVTRGRERMYVRGEVLRVWAVAFGHAPHLD